jgi:hypothetical protein
MTDTTTTTTITDEYIAVATYEDGELTDRTEIKLSELGFLAPPGEDVHVTLTVDGETVSLSDDGGHLEDATVLGDEATAD